MSLTDVAGAAEEPLERFLGRTVTGEVRKAVLRMEGRQAGLCQVWVVLAVRLPRPGGLGSSLL